MTNLIEYRKDMTETDWLQYLAQDRRMMRDFNASYGGDMPEVYDDEEAHRVAVAEGYEDFRELEVACGVR